MSDNKFLTSAQPKVMNPKENIKMTPEERSEGRKGLKAAVSAGLGMFPGGRAMQTLGRVGNAFANTARQYLAGRKMKNIAKKTSNFKDFHRGGRVYDRQAINDAFKARFRPQATRTPQMPKIETRTMTKDMFGRKYIGKDVTPKTNFGRPDATVQMRNAMRKSGQYPKSDPYRGAPGLR